MVGELGGCLTKNLIKLGIDGWRLYKNGSLKEKELER
jgi:hypothetical protein